MRALALDFDKRKIAEREVTEPEVRRGDEVKFRILEVGVCGTDRALAQFAIGHAPDGEQQLILGHEALGQVLETGSAVKRFAKGDLVVPTVRRRCEPACVFCKKGRADQCLTGLYTERGIMGANGYFADMAVDRERDLVKVPPKLRKVAILVEPFSVVEKAIRLGLDAYEGKPRHALILGAGPIGLIATMLLQSRNIPTIVHSLESPRSIRAKQVRELGAEYTDGAMPQADLVIEATGSTEAGFLAVRQLALSGVAVILGSFNGTGEFPFRDLILGNRKVLGSVNSSPRAFQDAVNDLQHLPAKPLHALIERIERKHWERTLLGKPGAAPKFVHVLHP